MALNKTQLQTALTLLTVAFASDATNAVLEEQLKSSLKEKLTDLEVDFQNDASTETLLEAYTLATSEDDEANQEDDFFQFIAKVGFKQPWEDGSFNKKKDEEFDEDDEALIKHLLSNNLIKRN